MSEQQAIDLLQTLHGMWIALCVIAGALFTGVIFK